MEGPAVDRRTVFAVWASCRGLGRDHAQHPRPHRERRLVGTRVADTNQGSTEDKRARGSGYHGVGGSAVRSERRAHGSEHTRRDGCGHTAGRNGHGAAVLDQGSGLPAGHRSVPMTDDDSVIVQMSQMSASSWTDHSPSTPGTLLQEAARR